MVHAWRPRMKTSCLLLVLIASGPIVAGPTVSLENRAICVRWDAGRGTMVSLKDQATGREWLDPAASPSLYRIQLVDQASPISSASATEIRVRKGKTDVTIEGTHGKPASLTVTCRFWLDSESLQLLGRIAIRQPWCRKTMTQRVAAGDIPKWLTEPNVVVTYSLRGTMKDGSLGNRIPWWSGRRSNGARGWAPRSRA